MGLEAIDGLRVVAGCQEGVGGICWVDTSKRHR